MEDEELQEDSENTSEEEQPSEKDEGGESEQPDWKAKADAMYGKFKEQKERVEELENKLGEYEEKRKGAPKLTKDVDIESLADDLAATQGLNSTERGRLIKESRLQDVSLQEARKSSDFRLWRSAYRDEQNKKKAPEPSTKQGSTPKVDAGKAAKALREGTIKKEEWDAVKGDPEKRRKFLRESGLTADYSRYDERRVPGVKRSRPSKKARRIPYEKTTRVGKE